MTIAAHGPRPAVFHKSKAVYVLEYRPLPRLGNSIQICAAAICWYMYKWMNETPAPSQSQFTWNRMDEYAWVPWEQCWVGLIFDSFQRLTKTTCRFFFNFSQSKRTFGIGRNLTGNQESILYISEEGNFLRTGNSYLLSDLSGTVKLRCPVFIPMCINYDRNHGLFLSLDVSCL